MEVVTIITIRDYFQKVVLKINKDFRDFPEDDDKEIEYYLRPDNLDNALEMFRSFALTFCDIKNLWLQKSNKSGLYQLIELTENEFIYRFEDFT